MPPRKWKLNSQGKVVSKSWRIGADIETWGVPDRLSYCLKVASPIDAGEAVNRFKQMGEVKVKGKPRTIIRVSSAKAGCIGGAKIILSEKNKAELAKYRAYMRKQKKV